MNNSFALTISPKDRVVDYVIRKIKNPLRAIYDDDIVVIRRALNRSCKDYTIYPELDLTGRLHYHGVIHIENMTNWKSSTCNTLKTIGFLCLKPNPSDGWKTYMTKEWNQTKKILEIEDPICYEPLRRGRKKQESSELKSQQKYKTILDYF